MLAGAVAAVLALGACSPARDPGPTRITVFAAASLQGAFDRIAAELEERLTAGGIAHDVKEYPEVGHSFMNDWGTPAPLRFVERIAGVAYSKPEAEDAWQRILDFFGERLHG